VRTPRQPLRVVVDSRLETPPGAQILQGGNTLIFVGDTANKPPPGIEAVSMPNAQGKVDLAAMMQELARRGVNELHVEAGFKLNGSLAREGCVDEFLIYLAPSFLGDSAQGMLELAQMSSLDERLRVSLRSVERVGEDLRIIARP
jgi:diaminohydroxyphosphoribosylaminopyrimidine deaminase/5-amino-6-(5-phosphoribosylamino)uracil reductase